MLANFLISLLIPGCYILVRIETLAPGAMGCFKCCTSGTEIRPFITVLDSRLDVFTSSHGFGQMSANAVGIALLMGH